MTFEERRAVMAMVDRLDEVRPYSSSTTEELTREIRELKQLFKYTVRALLEEMLLS